MHTGRAGRATARSAQWPRLFPRKGHSREVSPRRRGQKHFVSTCFFYHYFIFIRVFFRFACARCRVMSRVVPAANGLLALPLLAASIRGLKECTDVTTSGGKIFSLKNARMTPYFMISSGRQTPIKKVKISRIGESQRRVPARGAATGRHTPIEGIAGPWRGAHSDSD